MNSGGAGFNLSPPSGLPPQFAATWSSLVNSPAEQTFLNHLFPGTG